MTMNQSIVHHDLLLQDNTREIASIVWNCVITIFLCCWTSLCVNLPAPRDRPLDRFREKLNLCICAIVAPDFLMIVSISEWESARRSVQVLQKFKSIIPSGEHWTLRHAFYANMGGCHLETPDEDTFPVDADQLHYLISKGYVDYPTKLEEEIEDRNKRGGLARAVTVTQVLVFLVTTFARVFKHIAVTSLEVTTIAFVFAMLITSYFWKEKPQDIYRPFNLKSHVTLADILKGAGRRNSDSYTYTPLDFINPEENFLQLFWHACRLIPRYLSGGRLFKAVHERPVKRLQSDTFKPLSLRAEILVGTLVVAYRAIFLLSWNSAFPTLVEQRLWRVATVIMIVLPAVGGWIILAVDFAIVRKHRRSGPWLSELERLADAIKHRMKPQRWGVKKPQQTGTAAFDRPTKFLMGSLIIGYFYGIVYLFARAFVFVENLIELRRLPISAYTIIAWTRYLPHTIS